MMRNEKMNHDDIVYVILPKVIGAAAFVVAGAALVARKFGVLPYTPSPGSLESIATLGFGLYAGFAALQADSQSHKNETASSFGKRMLKAMTTKLFSMNL